MPDACLPPIDLNTVQPPLCDLAPTDSFEGFSGEIVDTDGATLEHGIFMTDETISVATDCKNHRAVYKRGVLVQ